MTLRYAILLHTGHGADHYDLLFETSPGSALATWRSPVWPLENGTPLTSLPDHRPVYLDYEGPVSNGRGTVRRVASGHHTLREDHPALLIVELEDGCILRLFRDSKHSAQAIRH